MRVLFNSLRSVQNARKVSGTIGKEGKMADAKTIAQRIKESFLTELAPHFRALRDDSRPSQYLYTAALTAGQVIAMGGLSHSLTLIERNVIEHYITDFVRGNGFEKKVWVRAMSGWAAGFLTQLILGKKRGFLGLLVRSAFDGFIGTMSLMLENPEQADDFLRAKFPELHEKLNSENLLQQIAMDLLGQIQPAGE
jgi:hypothetical protein